MERAIPVVLLSLLLMASTALEAQMAATALEGQPGTARIGVGAAIAVFEFRGEPFGRHLRAGVGVGPTARAVVTSPNHPQLEGEVGFLISSRPVDLRCVTGPCPQPRELHPILLVRLGMVWPLTGTDHGAYVSGSLAGYFPGQWSDILPGSPVGVEAAVGSRGAFGTGTAFAEIRVGLLMSGERTGRTIQMVIGAVY